MRRLLSLTFEIEILAESQEDTRRLLDMADALLKEVETVFSIFFPNDTIDLSLIDAYEVGKIILNTWKSNLVVPIAIACAILVFLALVGCYFYSKTESSGDDYFLIASENSKENFILV